VKRTTLVIDRDREETHPLHAAVVDAAAVSRAELLTWNAGQGSPVSLSWCDGSEDAVADVLEELAIVDDYALSPDAGGTYAFVWQDQPTLDPSVMALVSEPAVVALPPLRYDEDGTVTVTLVGTHDALRRLVATVGDRMDYTVTELTEYEGGGRPGGLTDRQRTALAVAVDVGYYDVPRTGTMATIAERLGCAESTASELLRKGQARVVRASVRGTAPESCSGRC
jgi:predicted DNA binding protein